jgi:O-antigen polymerase
VEAYLPFHTPKNYLLVTSIPFIAFWGLGNKHIRSKSNSGILISVIEILLFIRLAWLILSNPSIITHQSQLALWIIISLMLLTLWIRNIHSTRQEVFIHWLIRSVWVLALLQALVGLYQYISYDVADIASIKTPMIGTIGSPNGFAMFITLGILSLFFDSLRYKKQLYKLSAIIGMVFFLFAIFLNGSRGAVLSLTVTSILYLLLRIKEKLHVENQYYYRKKYFLHTGFIAMLIVSITAIGLYNVDKESSSGRLMVWEMSFPMLTDNPIFGVGFNRYAVEYLNYQVEYFSKPENASLSYKAANLKQAHNEFLQAFFETGIIGGLLFATIWFLPIIFFFTRGPTKKNKETFLPVVLLLVAILIHANVDTVLHVLPISVLAYILLGLIPIQNDSFYLSIKTVRPVAIPLVITLGFYSAFMIDKTIQQYPAYRIWQTGNEYSLKRQYNWAIYQFEASLNNLPGKGELQFHLGSSLVLSGEYSRGLVFLRESLETYNDRNIYLSMSYGYLRLRDYARAKELAQQALAMFPDHLAPHLLLGEIYYYLGDYNKSKKSLSKCINLQTRIRSNQTEQIKTDAEAFWKRFYEE